jgi:hypothetical protein
MIHSVDQGGEGVQGDSRAGTSKKQAKKKRTVARKKETEGENKRRRKELTTKDGLGISS